MTIDMYRSESKKMSVIRGKVFSEIEIVPEERTIGGVWPYTLNERGHWQSKDGVEVKVRPLFEAKKIKSEPLTPLAAIEKKLKL